MEKSNIAKNFPMIGKIIVILLILLVIILLICYFSNKNSDPDTYQGMTELFDNTTKDINNLGGILCNNFGPNWFQAMLDRGEVSLQDTSVCASVTRKTCTAYSYLRKDLIPMLFMFPGKESNVPCGIILDPKKVWSLITLMGIVDADTNNRSCCTNESGGSILTRNPYENEDSDACIYKSMTKQVKDGKLKQKYIDGTYAVYMAGKGDKGVTGGTCDTSCNGDRTCMYNNSGGNINQWLMNSSPDCIKGNYSNCFKFTEVNDNDVPQDAKNLIDPQPTDGWLLQTMSPDCETCKKPYLCVLKDAPTTGSTNQDKYKTVVEKDRIATYIGKDGFGMNTAVTQSMDLGTIAITQCRFERDDWNSWIKVLKDNYKNLLGLLRKDNSMVDSFNNQLANPASPSYFENEVNLYINPDTSSDEYKNQNKIWQDAIIGFYYTASTCEEQLAPLEGIPSDFYGSTFSGSVDRCDGFFPDEDRQGRRDWEKNNISEARDLVHKVADLFEQTQNRKVPVYKCTANSNSFPNYQTLIDAFNEDVKLNSIFQLDNNYNN